MNVEKISVARLALALVVSVALLAAVAVASAEEPANFANVPLDARERGLVDAANKYRKPGTVIQQVDLLRAVERHEQATGRLVQSADDMRDAYFRSAYASEKGWTGHELGFIRGTRERPVGYSSLVDAAKHNTERASRIELHGGMPTSANPGGSKLGYDAVERAYAGGANQSERVVSSTQDVSRRLSTQLQTTVADTAADYAGALHSTTTTNVARTMEVVEDGARAARVGEVVEDVAKVAGKSPLRRIVPVLGWGLAFSMIAKDVRAEGVGGAMKLSHVENVAGNAPIANWVALVGDLTIGSALLGSAALSGSDPAYESLADAYPNSAAFWHSVGGPEAPPMSETAGKVPMVYRHLADPKTGRWIVRPTGEPWYDVTDHPEDPFWKTHPMPSKLIVKHPDGRTEEIELVTGR